MRLLLTTLLLAVPVAAGARLEEDPSVAHCSTGDPQACSRVLLERSCERDYAKSCAVLAAIWRSGTGVPRDLDKARSFLQRACDLGSRDSCRQLDVLPPPPAKPGEPVGVDGPRQARRILNLVTALTALVFLGGRVLRRRA